MLIEPFALSSNILSELALPVTSLTFSWAISENLIHFWKYSISVIYFCHFFKPIYPFFVNGPHSIQITSGSFKCTSGIALLPAKKNLFIILFIPFVTK